MSSLIIQNAVPIKDKIWFQTGGSARFFCEPATAAEFQEALEYAKTNNLPIFVLGSGANILVSDDGFDGLVIRPKTSGFTITNSDDGLYKLVTCSAGMTINDLIEETLSAGLIGLEVFSGIPGTLGGSAYINLHYFTHFLSDFVVAGQVIEKETGAIINVDRDWFGFGYNQSKLIAGNYYLVSITLKLACATEADVAYAQGRRYEIIRHRASRYPASHTCGSFFRNFHESEISLTWNDKKMIYIAFYLDKIGVKGVESVGGARVSWQHANMLVNAGHATSSDIVKLARILQQKVLDQFGIIPQPECIFIGFKEYPLLTQ